MKVTPSIGEYVKTSVSFVTRNLKLDVDFLIQFNIPETNVILTIIITGRVDCRQNSSFKRTDSSRTRDQALWYSVYILFRRIIPDSDEKAVIIDRDFRGLKNLYSIRLGSGQVIRSSQPSTVIYPIDQRLRVDIEFHEHLIANWQRIFLSCFHL